MKTKTGWRRPDDRASLSDNKWKLLRSLIDDEQHIITSLLMHRPTHLQYCTFLVMDDVIIARRTDVAEIIHFG